MRLMLALLLLPASALAMPFGTAVGVVMGFEGGYDPRDPSKYGITQETLDRTDIGPESVIHLTPHQAQRIYRKFYWTPIQGDTLPDGIDLALFDMAVQHGTERAVKALQRALGVTPDGIMGPETARALDRDCGLLVDLHARRAMLYARLDHMREHYHGWFSRLLRVHDLAMEACRSR